MLRKPLVVLSALLAAFPAGSTGEQAPPAALAERLSAASWQRVSDVAQPLAAEVTTWRFYRAGSYQKTITSDFAESQTGAWAISEVSGHEGVLFLAGSQHEPGRPAGSAVLSFRFCDGELRLGEERYQGTPPGSEDVAPKLGAEPRLAVTAEQRPRSFPLWATMTSSEWRADSTPPGDPSRLELRRTGTYTATFDATHCDYSGTWSLLSTGAHTGLLRLSVPANRCDPRGPTEAFVRETPVELNDTTLRLYQTAYLPSRRERM